jgi:hypothetical protein
LISQKQTNKQTKITKQQQQKPWTLLDGKVPKFTMAWLIIIQLHNRA